MKSVWDLWPGVRNYYQLDLEIKLFYKETNVRPEVMFKNYQNMVRKFVG